MENLTARRPREQRQGAVIAADQPCAGRGCPARARGKGLTVTLYQPYGAGFMPQEGGKVQKDESRIRLKTGGKDRRGDRA